MGNKRRAVASGAAHLLPEEMTTEVFLRLPVKAILRLRGRLPVLERRAFVRRILPSPHDQGRSGASTAEPVLHFTDSWFRRHRGVLKLIVRPRWRPAVHSRRRTRRRLHPRDTGAVPRPHPSPRSFRAGLLYLQRIHKGSYPVAPVPQGGVCDHWTWVWCTDEEVQGGEVIPRGSWW